MKLALAASAVLAVATPALAEPGKCDGGVCDLDQGRRPWLLEDACSDQTDVVGYRRCTPYAQWSADVRNPELELAAGVGLRHVFAPPPVVTGAMPSTARTVAAGSRPMADLATSEFRITGALHALYVGGELSIGDLTRKTYPYGAFTQGGGVIGAAIAIGPVDVAAEALIAGRSIRLTTNINRLAPAFTEVVIEARARAALWVVPWITLEAELGASVLDRSEWVAAAMLGLHTRAYGGRR